MYANEIKTLTDQQIKIGKEINDIRAKYDGKPGDLNGSELERFKTALNDYDNLSDQIKELQTMQGTLDSVEKASQRAVNDIERREYDARGAKVDRNQVLDAFSNALAKGVSQTGAYDQSAFRGELNNFVAGNPTKGGYSVVQEVLAATVIQLVEDDLWIRRLATVETLTNAESLGVVSFGDLDDFSWVSEVSDQSVSTESPFGKRTLTPTRSTKVVKMSKKLLRLNPNAAGMFLNKLAYVAGRTQEKAFLTGNGAGQPLGITFESTDGISTSRNRASGTANTVVADDFIRMVSDLKAAYRREAVFIMHRNLKGRISLLKDGANNYQWQPIGGTTSAGLTASWGETLRGIPVIESEFMPDPALTGSINTGTQVAVLGNFRRGYMIADATQLDITPLVEKYATSDEQGFACNVYCDGMPVDENAFVRLKIS